MACLLDILITQVTEDGIQATRPVSPVGATLAVHGKWWPDGAVGTQLCRAAIDERAVREDHLIPIPGSLTCEVEHGIKL